MSLRSLYCYFSNPYITAMLDTVVSGSGRQPGAVNLFGAVQYLEQLKLQRSNISLYQTGRHSWALCFPLLSLNPRYSCHSHMGKVESDGESSRDVFAILAVVEHSLLRGNPPPTSSTSVVNGRIWSTRLHSGNKEIHKLGWDFIGCFLQRVGNTKISLVFIFKQLPVVSLIILYNCVCPNLVLIINWQLRKGPKWKQGIWKQLLLGLFTL